MSFSRQGEIYRSDLALSITGSGGCYRRSHSSASMSFQSAIPWQVALQQCLPPLHRLRAILNQQPCRTMIFSANGNCPLNFVSHLRGALQKFPPPRCPTRDWLRIASES